MIHNLLFITLVPQNRSKAEEYELNYKMTDIMPANSVGLYTARDDFAIHWKQTEILTTLKDFISLPIEVAREKYQLGKDSSEWQVALARKDVLVSKLDVAIVCRVPQGRLSTPTVDLQCGPLL